MKDAIIHVDAKAMTVDARFGRQGEKLFPVDDWSSGGSPFLGIFSRSSAAQRVRVAASALLGIKVVSEMQFSILLACYRLNDISIEGGKFTLTRGVSADRWGSIIESLIARGLIEETDLRGDEDEGQFCLQLTSEGRETVVIAVHLLLNTAENIGFDWASLHRAGLVDARDEC